MGLFEIQAEPEVVDWLMSLAPAQLARADVVCGMLAVEGTCLGMPLSRPLGDGVWELRINLHPKDIRITYWFPGHDRVVLLTVFRKTRDAETAQVRRAKQAQKVCEAEHDTDQIISVIESPEGS
ncbi:type II toxin-antitoxin system RelE/ParE family toxin [Actinomadura luteofluorescens]|uniref:type II toxin-antitoxin system RelE/ParE family toxin n=1 Tax=Actinomadura luteofluorescens TaxID=46163 RepID=UPI0030D4509E